MMQMEILGTTDLSSRISRRIMKICGGICSHIIVRFKCPGNDQYFESWWHKDEHTGKDGIRGPRPVEKLATWLAEDEENRRVFRTGFLPISDDEARRSYQLSLWAVENIGYSNLQLFWNWTSHRLGGYVAKIHGDPKNWTCSEYGALMVPTRILTSHIRLGYVTYDMIVPSSKKRKTGLLEAMSDATGIHVASVAPSGLD